ncbi:hypothetical protein ACVWXN_000479 [Bradyrhizobium sp. i1.4.4]|uniref:hypothetical protein n=1 Tax=Bradyrhizobium TaxID=374 RepID=UPI001FD98422|nr:hypothetical protein [Bradyrhizobium japonicum]
MIVVGGDRTMKAAGCSAEEISPTTFVHDLAGRLRCSKCAKASRRPATTLLQLAQRAKHPDLET